jgi:methyltransferase (TIGR00027 family)
MTRTDNDSWDLASSVGATATMVAAARAAASRQEPPLVIDSFAEPLVRAAGIDLFARIARGDLEFDDVGTGWMTEFFGARARFFDSFFPAALSTDTRQAVIVASGLDSRAYRLQWPAATVVYELDQPSVIDFKNSVLEALGARPATQLRSVGVDLRHDWPTALRQAGFDPAQPSAWLIEGLLIGYLPNDGQERLLDRITALSAPGSQLTADHLPSSSGSVGVQLLQIAEDWRRQGYDVDFGGLTYSHERNDVVGRLQELGWRTTAYAFTDLLSAAERSGSKIDTGPNGPGAVAYFTAERDAGDVGDTSVYHGRAKKRQKSR